MMRFDYHMHTPLCGHAIGHPREYAAEAVRKGLQEIGFSEHNPMPSKFDDWRMDLADFPEYLRLVEEARLEFPQLPIRLGLECDFIPGKKSWIRELAKKADFDYFIGSVHYITPDWDVDNPLKLARWKDQPVEEVWTKYFKAMTQAACACDSRNASRITISFIYIPKAGFYPPPHTPLTPSPIQLSAVKSAHINN